MEQQSLDIRELNERINQKSAFIDLLQLELNKSIVGQKYMLERLLIGLLAQGHVLLEGVPGLAKTLAIKSLAKAISGQFSRIQFTPDLLPADILGTMIYNQQEHRFQVRKGPVFANFVLADEINRAPAKVQSALLEAMQEKQVTIGEQSFTLEEPFLVLATQNPIEQEGTYPLPEAQLDRFMFLITVDYPSRSEELEIARTTTGGSVPKLDHILDAAAVLRFQDLVRRVPVPQHIYEFAVDLVRRTRPKTKESPDWLKPLVSWGAGPRAVQYLILGAKSRAALTGSYMARLEDIMAVAEPVLTHRVLTTFNAESEGITSNDIISRLVEELNAEQVG